MEKKTLDGERKKEETACYRGKRRRRPANDHERGGGAARRGKKKGTGARTEKEKRCPWRKRQALTDLYLEKKIH